MALKYRGVYLFALFLLLGTAMKSQEKKGPTARFSFNNLKNYDEVSQRRVKLVGTNFTVDRFNNENSAVFLHGSPFSYINLGNYPAIKPVIGSISIWIKLQGEMWAGTGYTVNPIILTKNSNKNDFFESYGINYIPEQNIITAGCSKDSSMQVSITSVGDFELFEWHHLVLTWDNEFLSFYCDGKLENKLPKNFITKFVSTDSVLVGVSANKKNNRSSYMSADDIEFYDHVLNADDVLELYNAPNPNKGKMIFNWVLIAIGFGFIVLCIYFFAKHRLTVTLHKEKQRLELYNIILETELRVNRALMNPHFVFNSLNALQNFILKNENDRANHYLVKFSKLMRKILENNMSDSIPLEMEIDLLQKYLEIEDLRFEENIVHTIHVDPGVKPSAIKIPIMMLQPFIENAIWHGLLKKQGTKTIDISFFMHDVDYVECIIEDNGIGRKKNEDYNLEKKSLGISFVEQRLKLFNKIHGLNCSLLIQDKAGDAGTIVRIILPILNK
ncbi:MAG: histidine kinase [Bacteroidota bacterium]